MAQNKRIPWVRGIFQSLLQSHQKYLKCLWLSPNTDLGLARPQRFPVAISVVTVTADSLDVPSWATELCRAWPAVGLKAAEAFHPCCGRQGEMAARTLSLLSWAGVLLHTGPDLWGWCWHCPSATSVQHRLCAGWSSAGCVMLSHSTMYKTAKIGPSAGGYLPESDMKGGRKIDQIIQLSNYTESHCQLPDADFRELQKIWKVHESGFGSLTINCEFKLFIIFN